MSKKLTGIIVEVILLIATITSVSGTTLDSETCSKDLKQTENGDWWPMVQHDLQNTGSSTSSVPDSPNVFWTHIYNDTCTKYYSSHLILSENKIYIGRNWEINCLDATNGNEEWKYLVDTDDWFDGELVYAEGKIFFMTFYGNLICLDALTGAKEWNYFFDYSYFETQPIVSNDRLFIGGDRDKFLYCFDADPSDGIDEGLPDPSGSVYDLIWKFYTGGYYNVAYVTGIPCIENGSIYFATHGRIYGNDSRIFCVNTTTGQEVWEKETDIYTTNLVLYNHRIYYFDGGIDGQFNEICCIDADDPNIRYWNFNYGQYNPYIPPSAIANNKLYCSIYPTLYCFNASDGTILWQTESEMYDIVLADNKAVIINYTALKCYAADTGELLWVHPFLGNTRSVIISEGILYTNVEYWQSGRTCIHALGERGNSPSIDPPVITGETKVIWGNTRVYTFRAVDIENDALLYGINFPEKPLWWIGPFYSGNNATINYSWIDETEGTYTLRVKVRDVNNVESTWSSLNITVIQPLTIKIPSGLGVKVRIRNIYNESFLNIRYILLAETQKKNSSIAGTIASLNPGEKITLKHTMRGFGPIFIIIAMEVLGQRVYCGVLGLIIGKFVLVLKELYSNAPQRQYPLQFPAY